MTVTLTPAALDVLRAALSQYVDACPFGELDTALSTAAAIERQATGSIKSKDAFDTYYDLYWKPIFYRYHRYMITTGTGESDTPKAPMDPTARGKIVSHPAHDQAVLRHFIDNVRQAAAIDST